MAGKGETVKYIIDADTSGFTRGMATAAAESKITGAAIDRNLSRGSKSAENNFKDMRRSAQQTAGSIRAFGTALQGFRMTSIIIGVAALSGAVLELSGALAAAGSTATILFPALLQGAAAVATYKTGVAGLGAAWKAIQANNGKAFLDSMVNLGPAAKQVAYALAGLNKAFNGVRLNVQNALFAGLGDQMLRLGSLILPTINAGMQRVAQSMNSAAKQAGNLMANPMFSGLLATIFADTARTIDILSGALSPLLSIFTSLYLVTRPYVFYLAQQFVNLTKNAAAYLGSVRGQAALNLAIQEGLVALKELGHLVGAVFGFLTAIFRTSVNSGVSLITTLTGIVNSMTAWVNSAQGQKDLISLFNFTSLVLKRVSGDIGLVIQFFFGLLNAVDNLSPQVQTLLVNFLALALAIEPVGGYFLKLFGAIKTTGVAIFNMIQQAVLIFTALGAVASIVVIVAAAFIILGAIIRGPLGGALLIIGFAIAAYIALSWLASLASTTAAESFFEQGVAAMYAAEADGVLSELNVLLATTMYNTAIAAGDAGVGLGFAARGAAFLQAALIPLIVLAAGVLVILSMLGVFSSKGKQAQSTSIGLGNSLGALQKSMKDVGGGGQKAVTQGINPLSDALNNVGDAANAAQGSLASFDKMNVLQDPATAAGAGAMPIANVPSLPNFDGASMGAPTIDTGAFDKAISDMQKNLDGLQKQLKNPLANPFDALGKWIDSHPWIALAVLIPIVIAIGVAFAIFGFAAIAAAIGVGLTIGLIVLAVLAVIAIIIILWKNWDTVWAAIKQGASDVWQWIQSVWDSILAGAQAMLTAIGTWFSNEWDDIVRGAERLGTDVLNFFVDAWWGIQKAWDNVINFFVGIWWGIQNVFSVVALWLANVFLDAWNGIKTAWNAVGSFFSGIWNGIMGVFAGIGGWFRNVFQDAWNGITGIFGGLWSWFQNNVWNRIVGIFGGIGGSIGDAVSGAFKGAVNTALNFVSDFINGLIRAINSAIGMINHIPGVHIGTIGTVTLPRLAKGGIVSAPTIAEIGEHGQEAVMPLENNTGWIDKLASKINAAGGGSQPTNVTVELDGTKLGQIIIDRINERTQMSGKNAILV